MSRTTQIILPVSIMFILAVLSGCSTVEPEPRIYEPFIVESADLTISLTYLDDVTVEQRHGRNDARLYKNPYYGFPAVITKKRFYIFEMEASTTESKVHFKLDDINFRKGPVEGDAKTYDYLLRIWSYYNGGTSRTMKATLEETILPDEFTVSPGNPVHGYLAFAENYPKEGTEGSISFYLSTPSGETGRLEKPLYWNPDGLSDQRPENTGIFAGDSDNSE